MLDMKPREILGMLEEAAGTAMFKRKKEAAEKRIAHKQVKVQEINRVLADSITPQLDKLREEKAHYLKWSANNAEIERTERFCVAHDFSHAHAVVEKATQQEEGVQSQLTAERARRDSLVADLEKTTATHAALASQKAEQMEGDYKSLANAEEKLSKELVKANSVWQNQLRSLEEDKSQHEHLEAQLKGLAEQRGQLESQVTAKAELATVATNAAAALKQELATAQRQYQAVSAGMAQQEEMASGNAGGTSLKDQLIASEAEAKDQKSQAKQSGLRQAHLKKRVTALKKDLTKSSKEGAKLEKKRATAASQLSSAESALSTLGFDPAAEETLQSNKAHTEERLQAAQDVVEELSARLSGRLQFDFANPSQEF